MAQLQEDIYGRYKSTSTKSVDFLGNNIFDIPGASGTWFGNYSWPQSYQVITRDKTATAYAKGAVPDTNIANIYIAEAKFNRADAYLNLVRDFGFVPLITSEISSLAQSNLIYVVQSPIKDVYNFIIQDRLQGVIYQISGMVPIWAGFLSEQSKDYS